MLGLILALLLQGAPEPRPSVLVQPDWLQRPGGEDLKRAYPEAATKAHADGRSTIRCTVSAEGSLTNCRVTAEEPAGLGFGEAALKLSPLFKMRPLSRDGTPVDGGTVNIPIRFVMPDSAAVTAPEWIRRPLPQDFARVYPRAASKKRLSGQATIRCKVLVSGSLNACEVLSERPPEAGFGEAALKMAPLFHMKPQTVDGRPVSGAEITIPIMFVLPGGPMDPYAAALRCYGRTAGLAQRDPSSTQAADAATVWAHQALDLGAKSSIAPNVTENSLANARLAAASGDLNSAPTLAQCLAAVRKAGPQAKP